MQLCMRLCRKHCLKSDRTRAQWERARSLTVSQDRQVMRRITRVITMAMSGSAIGRPTATKPALSITPRLTKPSVRARSSDAGRTWRPTAMVGGRPAALDNAHDELLVALHDGTVKRSLDGGQSWQLRSTP